MKNEKETEEIIAIKKDMFEIMLMCMAESSKQKNEPLKIRKTYLIKMTKHWSCRKLQSVKQRPSLK